MTCCIAALANNRKNIILVADRQIGSATIGGEPDIRKYERVHKDWWVLLSGGVAVAVDVIERLKASLPRGPINALNMDAYLSTSVEKKWLDTTERLFLKPHGYSTETFRDEAPKKMPKSMFREISNQREMYSLGISLMVVGFDEDGLGNILSVSGDYGRERFDVFTHSIPGFYAIGTGSGGALYMMKYKEVSVGWEARAVAYYAVEGKYFGERGQGVGTDTDLVILRHNKKAVYMGPIKINRKIIENICQKIEPKKISKKYVKRMNKIKRLKKLPKIGL